MELKDFVKNTLIEIAKAITEAQKETEEMDIIINPAGLASNEKGEKYLRTNGWRYVQDIEINVGITEISNEGGKSGIGITAGFLKGGTAINSDNSNQNISSVKFNIPVALPSTPTPAGHGIKIKHTSVTQ